MKVKKAYSKGLISILLILTMLISPFTNVQAAKKDKNSTQSTVYKGEGYEVTFKITSQWADAFNADVTIKNTSNKVIDNWAIGFYMPYDITKIWNGVVESNEEGFCIIKNAGSNQDITAGNKVNFGFTVKCTGVLQLPNEFQLLCIEEEVQADKYEINFKVTSDWKSAFNGEISIKNISDEVIEDWKLQFDFDSNIERFWTAEIIEKNGSHYTIKNAGYSSNIKPGETVVLGFAGNPGSISTTPCSYKLLQVINRPVIEYVELPDGKIEKNYLYRAIYTNLLLRDLTIDNVRLSDDYDLDGLTLLDEYTYDTNPFLEDSDEDGLNDYIEINVYNTNPIKWDTDDDNMSDGTEVSSGLNPLNKDSDGDGIFDNEEIISQEVRLFSIETYDLSEVGTLPSINITGKGDFSRRLNAVKVENDDTVLEINSVVGSVYDFVHEDELEFDESILTFNINDDILEDNSLENLAIAWYNEEMNALEPLATTYDSDSKTISAEVDHYSIYTVINLIDYFFDIDWKNEGAIINSGKADVVFVVDTTGSMSSPISNVRNNINQFVTELEDNKIDIRLGLIEYRDIYEDGVGSTKLYDWYTNVNDFKNKLGTLGVSGGGDGPESAVDALHSAQKMSFRTGVKKYIILITDADYKNGIVGNSSVTMQDEIRNLVSQSIVTSVVTRSNYFTTYSQLVNDTDGVTGNILNNFANELRPLITKMGDQVNSGCWIRLSNGSIVCLDKDPSLGDETVDTDKDGIPDIIELNSIYKVAAFNPYTKEIQLVDSWSFYSNPDKKDTDGDGLYDIDDLRKSKYDIVIIEENEDIIAFNTGRTWYNITCSSYDYMDNLPARAYKIPENPIPVKEFQVLSDNMKKNKNQTFNLEELTVIGLLNNEGAKFYMDSVSTDTREIVFKRIVNRESNYYKHTGSLWWSDWKKVSKGTESGFFKGLVFSEADINFSLNLYKKFDVYMVLDILAEIGVVVIVIIVAIKATPVVLANIQGIIFYIKMFGVIEGLDMYLHLGINYLPNSVITWIQWDVADGDSSLDDILVVGKESTNTTKIYRVVNDTEFQLIKDKGQFEELPQYMSSKWFFANDIEYAKKWSQAYYPDGKYKIIQIYAPNELLKGVYYTEKIDLIGPAYCFELHEINNVLNSIKK